MFVSVAVENTIYSFDKPFTYLVPSTLEDKIEVGMRVTVPFGNGNTLRIAMVLEKFSVFEGEKFKEVSEILDDEPVLTKEMIELVYFMKERYFCTLFDCIRLMLPAGISYKVETGYVLDGEYNEDENLDETETQVLNLIKTSKKELSEKQIRETLGLSEKSKVLSELKIKGYIKAVELTKRKTGDASQKMIRVAESFAGKLTPKQEYVYETLRDCGEVTLKELTYYTGASNAIIKNLKDKGAVELFEQEIYRKPKHLTASFEKSDKSITLSIEQDRVFDSLIDEFESGQKVVSLLYGITGSGKTSVFLKLIDYVMGKEKDIILMVPEISLTPQTIDLFKRQFENQIAIFHSGLSVGERLDEWKRVNRGECRIAIGTRSAVFAPFKNLGLIVIDEEQEHTYKSEMTPRYNAKEIAKFRCSYNKAFCLLSSATPSVESYYRAVKGIYGFNSLDVRYGDAQLPNVRVIDMNNEEVFGNKTDISFALKRSLNDNLRDGRQSIILLNRRGYNTYARCSQCRATITCPNCSISLILHSANNRLMCHYCGYSREFSSECTECGEDAVGFTGYGTQRAEESLALAVPGARILRIDADSTGAKYSLEKKLDAFANGEYDIMVGTQMVAKGLNFDNVTLVGVISADPSLYSDDFRSSERTFDLITQVVGRSGRGKYRGEAIIQTYVPENAYLQIAANQDYFTFYEMEITYRMAMLYPPFVDLLQIGFTGEDEKKTENAANVFLNSLSQKFNESDKKIPIRILKPSAAAVAKIYGKYRYKIIIKSKNTVHFREIIRNQLIEFSKLKEFDEVSVFADMNPNTIM